MRHARWCVYASQFLHKVAWGAYSVVSPFYLALFMSTAAAANVATAEWAAYSIGQVLCTPILGAATDQAGRRPVFVVCQMLITIVFLVLFWPNLYWWAITGFVQGCFSCTWAVSITILVDCVSNGAPPGGDDDILIMRLFRRIATPASETLDGEVRQGTRGRRHGFMVRRWSRRSSRLRCRIWFMGYIAIMVSYRVVRLLPVGWGVDCLRVSAGDGAVEQTLLLRGGAGLRVDRGPRRKLKP